MSENKCLYSFLELDIGQVYEHIYLKDFRIKLSRTMYFNLSDNCLGRMTPELLHSPSKTYIKCTFNVGEELNKDNYVEGYTDSCVLFTNDIKNFINEYDHNLHTDFCRGYHAALRDLKEYFEFRGFVFDENSNQDTV